MEEINLLVPHVIEAIAVPEEHAEGTIRVSFGFANNETDVITVAEAIASILKKSQGAT